MCHPGRQGDGPQQEGVSAGRARPRPAAAGAEQGTGDAESSADVIMGKQGVGTVVGLEPGRTPAAADQGVLVGVEELFPAPRRHGQAKESVRKEPGFAG